MSNVLVLSVTSITILVILSALSATLIADAVLPLYVFQWPDILDRRREYGEGLILRKYLQ